MNALVIFIICVSAIGVYIDATRHKIGKIPNKGGVTNMSAGNWATVTFMLWIVGLPIYLFNRQRLIAEAKDSPVEAGGRGLKIALMSVLTLFWLALGAAMDRQEEQLASASSAEIESARTLEQAIRALEEDVGGQEEAEPAPAPSDEPLPEVTTRELWNAYENNEMRADAAFKGKRFIIEGRVHQVSKDVFGNPVVQLRGPNQFIPIQARLIDDGLAMELDKGTRVRWVCTGAGKSVMSPELNRCAPE